MSSKIIWIASYPKSGNTWIRYLLSNYFFNLNRNFDFNIVYKIDKFPTAKYFKFVNGLEIKNKPSNISKYWIEAQKKIKIIGGNFTFLKTHNPLATINGNSFTDEDISLAIIHLVRDPRDVVISYSKYLNKDYEEIIDFLIKDDLATRININNPLGVETIGSWKFNFLSWRDGIPAIPRILLRYEDLLEDTYNVFYKLIYFLSKILKFQIDQDQIKFSIENSNFDILRKNEKKNGFAENYKKNNFFFRKGRAHQWKNILKSDQIKKIENAFGDEMEFLNYL